MDAFPFIGLCHEILKSPPIPAGAEQKIKHASTRKQVIAEDEILQVVVVEQYRNFADMYLCLESVAALEVF